MNSTSRCSNHELYQISLDKVHPLTKPLLPFASYLRLIFDKANIEKSVDRAIKYHSFSMLSEDLNQPLLAKRLSEQAVKILQREDFNVGDHHELDKIFQHHALVSIPKEQVNRIYESMKQKLSELYAKEFTYNEALENEVDPKKIESAGEQWRQSLNPAISHCKKEFAGLHLPMPFMPPLLASPFARLFISYGLMHYADPEASHPFKFSLENLRAAFLFLNYHLGFSSFCPDLNSIEQAADFAKYSKQISKLSQQADAALNEMDPDRWAEKLASLPQEEMLSFLALLSYLHGAMENMQLSNFALSNKILTSVEKTLKLAMHNPDYELSIIKNRLAEFKFYEYSGYLAKQIRKYECEGQIAKAEETREALVTLWEECINLSKDPDLMWARCLSKHPFLVEMKVEEKIHLFQQALDIYLSKPRDKQHPLVLAVAWHNLSHIQKELGEQANAKNSAKEALAFAEKCVAIGYPYNQLQEIIEWAKRLRAE